MIKITYIEAGGAEHVVEAKPGDSVMETAVNNNVPGIAADCGGACACATCRVYVEEPWRDKTGEPLDMERSMIEYAEDPTSGVRLACQINVVPELDGLVVRMPESQH